MPKSTKKRKKQEEAPALSNSKDAVYQRQYRAATGYSYEKKYKKAREEALKRLAQECPNRFRRIMDEERAKVGLGPARRPKK